MSLVRILVLMSLVRTLVLVSAGEGRKKIRFSEDVRTGRSSSCCEEDVGAVKDKCNQNDHQNLAPRLLVLSVNHTSSSVKKW